MQEFDICAAIEHGKWTGFQRFILVLVMFGIVLDGFNNQIIGYAVPALTESWHLTSAAFAPLVGATLIAMSVGTMVAGLAGDRFGRKVALVVSIFLFGVATLASALSTSLSSLFVLRILGAIGLGGAIPNGTVLLAEYTPASRRGLAVSLGIVGVPLGGVVGGVIAATTLPTFGWRMLFVIGGGLPLAIGTIMVIWLPEAPRQLLLRPDARTKLVAVLRRCGFVVSRETPLVAPAVRSGRSAPLEILKRPLLANTVYLWLAFFFCLLSVYVMFNWLPALLHSAGFALSAASSGLGGFNLGGIAGAVLGGLAVDRFGFRIPLAAGAACGALMAVAIAAGTLPLTNGVVEAVAVLTLFGLFIQGVQSTLFALAIHLYPENMRATGVGAALGLGRLGAVASAVAGVVLQSGTAILFGVIAGSMFCVAGSLLSIKQPNRPAKPLRLREE